MFEKPVGMRDTLPLLYKRKQEVRSRVAGVMEGYGYEFLETPTLEFYETVGEASAILDQQLFKLMDQQGYSLVLRPDMTAPIARLAASRLYTGGYPLRLAYSTNVFRAQQREGGRPAEFEHIGVELIGDQTASADAEVITLLIDSLQEAGLSEFTVALGHVGFVNALFLEILGTEERASEIRRFLYEKNYVGYREHIKGLTLSSIDKEKLLALMQLRGKENVINLARELVQGEKALKALKELEDVVKALEVSGVMSAVKLDLNLVSHMSYYTGVVFEGYSANVGYPICSGGRYDQLLAKFDRPAAATGFAIRMDYLLEAIPEFQETNSIECVIFSEERRKEALAYVSEKREQGKKLIMQEISGVEHIDSYTNRFTEVTYLIGAAGRDSR
ncbi:ATP phosphoribosyltransferase regulatory subunit [Bacillus sp. BGMRC 2118]|nr:ATP phosphoribosyltransferase regulatory subunit [Bacillus sp. BGMRC 2118]